MSGSEPITTPAGVEPAFDLATYYPIFLYLGNIMFGGHLRRLVNTYTSWVANQFYPSDVTNPPPAAVGYWVNFANAWGALLVLVFLAYWLYRRKIFIRL